jgi:hypothetical protein
MEVSNRVVELFLKICPSNAVKRGLTGRVTQPQLIDLIGGGGDFRFQISQLLLMPPCELLFGF